MRYTVQQFISTILLISLLYTTFLVGLSPVYSVTADDLESEINRKQEELSKNKSTLSAIEKRIKEISGSSYSLTEKINLLNAEITKLQSDIETKNKEIEEKQKLLELKKSSFDMVSTQLYMETRQNSAQMFFSFGNLDNLLQNLFVKKNAISILREDIEKINGEFTSLSQIKEDLDKQKKDLDDSYALVQAEKVKLQKELSAQLAAKKSVTSRISSLTSSLSSLQKELLYSRLGGTHVNPASVPSGGDHWGSLLGFNEVAPIGSFAVFSIGAYTNREGLSQWGAKARAEAGQNYQQILNAYYPYANIANDSTNKITINVLFCDPGYSCRECMNPKISSYDLETDYLYRLGEMPENFGTEALKAQAIAARTYVLNATNYGTNTVRGDECGQVIAGQKTGSWKSAVDATRGVVMKKNGSVFSSQYAAINGGWVRNGVNWDTVDKVGDVDGNWVSRAWDTLTQTGKVGTYYWFYKSWYRSGYSVGSSISASSCNRTPWLSPQEMADIVNAASRLQDLGATDKYADSRIVPIYDSCHSQGSPYSYIEMKNASSSKFTKVVSATTVNGNGTTSKIIFRNEDGRVIEIEGGFFKLAFNLRAPGYLRIPQNNFLHINIHKK